MLTGDGEEYDGDDGDDGFDAAEEDDLRTPHGSDFGGDDNDDDAFAGVVSDDEECRGNDGVSIDVASHGTAALEARVLEASHSSDDNDSRNNDAAYDDIWREIAHGARPSATAHAAKTEVKSRLTEYSMTSSVLPRSEALQNVDLGFEAMIAEVRLQPPPPPPPPPRPCSSFFRMPPLHLLHL